ncbi:MAG TPA: SAM-dependent methyltransferase [Pseudonocardiaceae bacterium]|jgi:O-methyltransferase involved in polyketide biosynthesis|nr:SAM-dependent methyltransferase [Pseudonocardiaceae bacterium]
MRPADGHAEDDQDLDTAKAVLRDSENRPSEARVYDYYLGGAANFEVDRQFAEAQIARYPDMPMIASENRRFLHRAVHFLVESGIRQFVDIGSGVPTEGNVHQVAEQAFPGECRVIYIDRDPIAHAHAQILLREDGDPARHRALRGDLLETGDLWRRVTATGLIDFSQPVALLIVAVLHFIKPDREPEKAVEFLRSKLAPGSFLVISHASGEGLSSRQQNAAERVRSSYETQAANPGWFRPQHEIEEFFGGWPLEPPGLVWTPEWHTEKTVSGFTDNPARAFIMAGVARKPRPEPEP